jgi:putative flavoprotein involved in K+ transport
MRGEQIETAIVGGGQAGLAMSYHLTRLGREHIVLERGRVAQRWRSERWDSLCFQAPNWNMRLPGRAFSADDPDAFAPRDDVVRFLEGYASFIRAPVRQGVAVTALRRKSGSERFALETSAGCIEAKNVVIATGPYQAPAPTLPLGSAALELHSTQYRNPEQLPPGAVLVVGSGNSGCQIAEELCWAGRRVYLSVSGHERTPRRYRGKDCIWWYEATGMADETIGQWQGKRLSRLMTGVGGGHDMDLRRLAADGVVLLGRVIGGQDGKIVIAPDLHENLVRGDASLVEFTRRCDEHAAGNGWNLPAADESGEVLPDPREATDPIRELDLGRAGVSIIVWANGSRFDLDWIDLPVCSNGAGLNRRPLHTRGVTSVPGVYFLGLPWLHKWKSAFLFGVGEDAEHLAVHVASDRRSTGSALRSRHYSMES